MKAVIYRGVNDLRIEDIPEPHIENPTDVVLKVTTAAICGSDLHVKHAGLWKPGRIMGHEYCGIVVAAGSKIRHLKKGDRVAGHPVASCGECFYCRKKQQALCTHAGISGGPDGSVKLGVQAEYTRIPFADHTLTKIPDDLLDEDVIFVGDILSTGLSGILRTHVKLGDSVAVFGAGPVGLSSVACAPLFGAGLVIAVDVLDYRLDVAKRFGAVTINASKENPEAAIMTLTDKRGVDAGIEAAGLESTLRACLKSTRRGGEVSILGTVPPGFLFDLNERFFDIFSLSVGLGDQNHIEGLIELIRNGKLDLKPLITHNFPLTEALQAYEVFEKKLEGCIKVLLKP